MALKITVGMIIGYHFNIVIKLSKKPIDSDIERLYDLISHNKTWNPYRLLQMKILIVGPWINLVVTLLNHDTILLKIETNKKTLKF